MGAVGEFGVGNIALDQDKHDEEKEKKKGNTVDYAKLEADIAANKELATKVLELDWLLIIPIVLPKHTRICDLSEHASAFGQIRGLVLTHSGNSPPLYSSCNS